MKWLKPKNNIIYWHLTKETKDLELYRQIIAIGKAFDVWGTYLYPIQFRSTSDPLEAQISIQFIHNWHPILQWHEFKTINWFWYWPESKRPWQLYLNDEKDWMEYDMLPTLIHELWHVLGIAEHAESENDVMYGKRSKNRPLTPWPDTIGKLRQIYETDRSDGYALALSFILKRWQVYFLTQERVNYLARILGVENTRKAIDRRLFN